jgi:pilus assembly protein CpaC
MRNEAHPMPTRTFPRAAMLSACLAATVVASLGLARAGQSAANSPASPPPVSVVASEYSSNFVPLGIGKSVVIDLPGDIKDVLVANPKVANAVIRTARRAFLIGVDVGQTNVYFFDAEGRRLGSFDIAVTRDLNGLRQALKQMFPEGTVHVEGIGEGVLLSGVVATPIEAQHAYDIATKLVGDSIKVVNQIAIRGRDEVMLKVTVAEVYRQVIKQFGINMQTNGTGLGQGQAVLNFVTSNPFSAALESIGNTSVTARFGGVTSMLQAMERAGVLHMLAEPTLTAISGESATFLAGGEFPIPGIPACTYGSTGSVQTCTPSVEYKKYGVTLNFTPVVLGAGKISLKVITEVSNLSGENSLVLNYTGTNSNITVPSLKVRRADTTVEIPSGGALAMAGMLQDQSAEALNGFPGLMDVPILGTLFRSRDYLNQKTDLMILVTPYIVHPVASKELALPDDGYADAPDPSAVLLGRLNRLYGGPGAADAPGPYRGNPGPYRGNVGFILD